MVEQEGSFLAALEVVVPQAAGSPALQSLARGHPEKRRRQSLVHSKERADVIFRLICQLCSC